MLRVAARGLRAPPLELAVAVRSRCSAFEGRPPVHPTLVLEESVTGLEPGFPMVTDKEIWKQPEMLLPERAELWYDDGTAVPEFYIDNEFPVSDSRALAECASAIAVIVCGGLALGYLLGDRLNPTQGAPWEEHSLPFDLQQEFGGMKREWPRTARAPEDD